MDAGRARFALAPERRTETTLELQLPGLADQIDAETMVLLHGDAAEAGALINSAGRDQDALGPQRDRRVTGVACETDALLGQRTSDAKSARLLLHQQQAQFGDLIGRLDQEDRTGGFAADFRDPAMLARSVV